MKETREKMKRDDTPIRPKFETIFIFPPPVYLNIHLFVVDFVIRSAHRDNNWIHLKKLSRAEEKEERSVKRRGA